MSGKLNLAIINGKTIHIHEHVDEEFVIVDGVLLAYNGMEDNITIPEAVTETFVQALHACKVKSIVVPNTVKKIGAKSFQNCSKLENITIPEGVETLENATFMHCFSLKEISLPDSITTIKNGVFWECHNLEFIKLPDNLVTIGEDSFLGCQKLKELVLPDTVTEIGDNCFETCVGLKKIVFPEKIRKIGDTKILKSTKKYVRIDGEELCYVSSAKQYAKQFNKKVDVEKFETTYANIEYMPKTDAEVKEISRAIVNRILKVLVLVDENLWLDYARFADEKSLKNVFAKMEKLSKTLKDKKKDKHNKILLINMRGALMLNESKLAQDYLKK